MLKKKSESQESLRSTAVQVGKRKQRSPLQKRQMKLFLGLGGAAAVAATLGSVLAISLSSRPLDKNGVSPHLPNSPENLTNVLSATLTRPVNLLVLGIDNDDSFVKPHLSTQPRSNDSLNSNTDTMLLVRFLPDNNQINVLSIPRDTLVRLPGVGVAKIDSTNWRGGLKLAAATVSHQLEDVTIDRYIRISRTGFINMVDALGGIEVTVPKKMDYVDQTQHLNIHFLPGRQKLNGKHMEEYVRFRHDRLGDIGRVQRQQEVLKAIQRTLLQPDTITKVPTLLQIAQENIDTDLSLDEMLALVHATLTSDRAKNNFLMLPGRYSRRDEYKRSFWIPNPKAAEPILTRYFDVHPQSESGTPDVTTALLPSQVKVAVANASAQPGAVESVISMLRQQGFTNVRLTDDDINLSDDEINKTHIIAQHGNPEDASAVQKVLGMGEVQVSATGDIWSDVTVVVGSDFQHQSSGR